MIYISINSAYFWNNQIFPWLPNVSLISTCIHKYSKIYLQGHSWGLRGHPFIKGHLSLERTPFYQGKLLRGHPFIKGNFQKTVSHLPHIREAATKGHPSCRHTFTGILRCPLKTGFTVRQISQITMCFCLKAAIRLLCTYSEWAPSSLLGNSPLHTHLKWRFSQSMSLLILVTFIA